MVEQMRGFNAVFHLSRFCASPASDFFHPRLLTKRRLVAHQHHHYQVRLEDFYLLVLRRYIAEAPKGTALDKHWQMRS